MNHRVVSQAIVAAVGDTESEPFWTAFLRSLKDRGLNGVQLVISDAHTGLKRAIATTLQGSAWQRCRVHFMRNVVAVVPKGNSEMVASIIRTIFAQPDTKHVRTQFEEVTRMLERSHPRVGVMLDDAKENLWRSPVSRPSIGARSGRRTR